MKTLHLLLDWTQGQPPPSDERHSSSTRRFTTSSTQFHPIGGRRHDRAGPGQIEDEGVEVGVHSRLRHQRRALLELVDVDQPQRDRVVSPPQRSVAVGVRDAHRVFVVDVRHSPLRTGYSVQVVGRYGRMNAMHASLLCWSFVSANAINIFA